MDVVSELLQKIAVDVVTILAPVAVAFVAAWLSRQTQLVKAKLNAEQWKLITSVVDAAVVAAEQSGLAGYIKDLGSEKRDYALNYAQKFLAQYKITVDTQVLYKLIEQAVYDNFQWRKLPDEGVGVGGLSETPPNKIG